VFSLFSYGARESTLSTCGARSASQKMPTCVYARSLYWHSSRDLLLRAELLPADLRLAIAAFMTTSRRNPEIFSIWDTSPELHPKVTQADAKTLRNRFGGEGEAATRTILGTESGRPFQFFVRIPPGKEPNHPTRNTTFSTGEERVLHSQRDNQTSRTAMRRLAT